MPDIDSTLQVRSTATSEGRIEVTLSRVPVPRPGDDEVVVRIDATPINPSDLNLLLGGVDPAKLEGSGSGEDARLFGELSSGAARAAAARAGKALPVGNEGAGVVVAAGGSPDAQALIGKAVAVVGGGMYSQHRTLKAKEVAPLPDGVTPADAGSSFVNPMTVLGMVETMRADGHTGLVHTAAASNVGQMLVKLCLEERVPLVNIVRSQAQADILRGLGAEHVCDSSSQGFGQDLVEALTATGSTTLFDAIGGGRLVSQVLGAMETASLKRGAPVTAYGTATMKQAYIYGGLDTGATEIVRSFGMFWRVGGWFVGAFAQQIGMERAMELRRRIFSELHGVFASNFTREISLTELLDPEIARAYAQRATGGKYLLNPNR